MIITTAKYLLKDYINNKVIKNVKNKTLTVMGRIQDLE
jgi:hypothetical protein